MERWEKNNIFNTSIKLLPFLVSALVFVQFIFYLGAEVVNPYYIISITADFAGMIVGMVLLVGLYMDMKKNGDTVKYLIGLVTATYVALFTDAMAWFVQGKPEYRMVSVACNTFFYASTISQTFFFWKYTLSYLRIKNNKIKTGNYIVNIGYVISFLLIILNLFFWFYFSVDKEGYYARSSFNLLSIIYPLLCLVFSLIAVVVERKQLRGLQIFAFFMYATGPLIASGFTIFQFGLSLNPAVTMISALLMYCSLNVVQGDKKAIAENEISIASSIQENILPRAFPYLPERKEFDIYAVMKPAREVGGDFYDFFMADDNHLTLVIADVSGKGIPAALFMMTSRTLIKNRVQAGGELAKIMEDVNNQLCDGNIADMFVTVWLAIVELDTGIVKTVNAGHEYPAIKRANEKFKLVIKKNSLAVAFFPETSYKEEEFKLEKGDSIFVYTDGVTEAMNVNEELFSKERLINALNENPTLSPKATIEKVLDSIYDFVKDAEQFDDITMLCMTYYGME